MAHEMFPDPSVLQRAFPEAVFHDLTTTGVGIVPSLGFAAIENADGSIELLGVHVPPFPDEATLPETLIPLIDLDEVADRRRGILLGREGVLDRFYNTPAASAGGRYQRIESGIYALPIPNPRAIYAADHSFRELEAATGDPAEVIQAINRRQGAKMAAAYMLETPEDRALRISRGGAEVPVDMPPAYIAPLSTQLTARLVGTTEFSHRQVWNYF